MIRRIAALASAAVICSSMLFLAGTVLAANPAADLDQCANDPLPSPVADGCDTSPTQWVNGNLGASKSVYKEDNSVPYRMRFSNLVLVSPQTGDPIVHHVIIEWDTTKAGKHAFDYLTTWNRTVTTANPCLGVTFVLPATCDAASPTDNATSIPLDSQVAGAGKIQIPGVFTMWGATVVGVSVITFPNGTGFAGDKTARLTLDFTASQRNPVLAWGGHIANRRDWPGLSAINISGSPYHMRLIDLDGAGGNQDRSLSAEAVIFPGKITIIKNADGATATFTFSGADFTPNPFTLVDGASITPNPSKVSNDILTFGNKTVSETSPLPGYKLGSIGCTTDNGSTNQTGTVNAGGAGGTANITVEEGENVICTFNNLEQRTSLSIVKDVVDVDGDTTSPVVDAAGDVIHYSINISNGGNVTLSGVTVTDPFANAGSIVRGTDVSGDNDGLFEAGETWHYTASHTVTQAEIDAGGNCDGTDEGTAFDALCNTATADTTETAPVTDDATVPVTPTATLAVDKSVTGINSSTTPPFVVTTAGDVIHYTITVDNTGTVTLTGVTVTDPFCTTGPTYVSGDTNSDSKLQVTETWTYSCSHTVTQAEIDAGGNYDTDDVGTAFDVLRNVAVGDSNESPSDDDDATVPVTPTATLAVDKSVTGINSSTTPPFVVTTAGDVIHYTITVDNTGTVTLTGVTVTDPFCTTGPTYVSGDTNSDSKLQVTETWTYSCSHTVTQAEIDAGGNYDTDDVGTAFDVLRNVAVGDSNESPSDDDDATVPVTPTATLAVDKSVTGINSSTTPPFVVTTAGDVIHYTITVDNTGTVTLTGVTVTDPFCTTGPTYVSGDTNSDSKLQVTETWTYSCSHTVTQAEIDAGGNYDTDDVGTAFDVLRNVAVGDSNESPSDDDDATVPVTPTATLAVDKSVTGINSSTTPPFVVTTAGDVIHYTITVDNTGTVTLTGVTVTDPFCTTGPTYVSGDTNSDSKLQVTETWTYSCSHTVTQAEIDAGGNYDTDDVDALFDVLRNVAVGDSNESPSDDDDATVPVNVLGAIGTEDYFIPQDVITLSGLTTDAAGDLYVALRIDGTSCDSLVAPAWDYTWEGIGNDVYRTADVTGTDANDVIVEFDATVRWCTSYSGDAHNAAIPLSDRGEVVEIDFLDKGTAAAIGFAIPTLAWFLWSRRKRDQKAN